MRLSLAIRMLRLLEELGSHPTDVSLKDLSHALDASKHAVQRRLQQLMAAGYVLRARSGYRLTPAAFRLAYKLLAVRAPSHGFRPYIEQLMECSGESAYIGVLDRDRRVVSYIDAVYSNQSYRHVIPVGETSPLHSTSAGLLLLAFTIPEWQEEYMQWAHLDERPSHAPSSGSALRRRLSAIRKLGVSLCFDKQVNGSMEISAPIYDAAGTVSATISMGGPSARLLNRVDELQHMVASIAARACVRREAESPPPR